MPIENDDDLPPELQALLDALRAQGLDATATPIRRTDDGEIAPESVRAIGDQMARANGKQIETLFKQLGVAALKGAKIGLGAQFIGVLADPNLPADSPDHEGTALVICLAGKLPVADLRRIADYATASMQDMVLDQGRDISIVQITEPKPKPTDESNDE